MKAGDIAHEHGDICLRPGSPPISEGLLALPFAQAFAALSHGWRIKGMDDLEYVHVQRGGSVSQARDARNGKRPAPG